MRELRPIAEWATLERSPFVGSFAANLKTRFTSRISPFLGYRPAGLVHHQGARPMVIRDDLEVTEAGDQVVTTDGRVRPIFGQHREVHVVVTGAEMTWIENDAEVASRTRLGMEPIGRAGESRNPMIPQRQKRYEIQAGVGTASVTRDAATKLEAAIERHRRSSFASDEHSQL